MKRIKEKPSNKPTDKPDLILLARVSDDGWHCEPSCPFLLPIHEVDGKCTKLGIDLDWYDYYIAACNN